MDTTSELTAPARAVKVLGGPSSTARILGLPGGRHQTVQSWIRNRIPAEHCPAIERATRVAGQPVLCEELRPDVDWGVLRENQVEVTTLTTGSSDEPASTEAGGAA